MSHTHNNHDCALNAATNIEGTKKHFSTYSFPTWLLIFLILMAIIMIIWQLVICGKGGYGDTWSYMSAWYYHIKGMRPDPTRTPVFPILIGLSFDIFGEYTGGIVLMILNWTVWIAGCRWLWFVLQYFGVGKNIRYLTIFIMIAFPGTWVLNNYLQIDGLSIGGFPLFIWQLIRFQRTGKLKWIIYSGLLLITYVYLKPQFLFLIPLWSIVWIYLSIHKTKYLAITIGIITLTIGSLVFYMWCLKLFYNQDSISRTATYNNYYGLRMAGLIYPEEIKDSVAREALLPFLEADPGSDLPNHFLYWDEGYHVTYDATAAICENAIKLHRKEALAFIMHRIPQTMNMSMFYGRCMNRPVDQPKHLAYYNVINETPQPDPQIVVSGSDLFKAGEAEPFTLIFPLYGIMDLPFWVAWLTMGIFSVWYLAVWIKRKQFPVVAFYMATILWGGYATVFIGAPGEWGRLVTPFCMLLFAMWGIIVSNVKKTLSGRGLWRRGFA